MALLKLGAAILQIHGLVQTFFWKYVYSYGRRHYVFALSIHMHVPFLQTQYLKKTLK